MNHQIPLGHHHRKCRRYTWEIVSTHLNRFETTNFLQELIEDYESKQVQSGEANDLGDNGEYYWEYYEDSDEDDDEDGGTGAEEDTEDPLLAQPTTVSQERQVA